MLILLTIRYPVFFVHTAVSKWLVLICLELLGTPILNRESIAVIIIINQLQAIQLIKQEKKLKVPDDYVENFRKTDAVFKYQSVFDPRSKKVVRLNEVSEHEDISNEELAFAGPYPSHYINFILINHILILY